MLGFVSLGLRPQIGAWHPKAYRREWRHRQVILLSRDVWITIMCIKFIYHEGGRMSTSLVLIGSRLEAIPSRDEGN